MLLILVHLGMHLHLTQVATTGSMVRWKTIRELCNSSRLGSQRKKAVVDTCFNYAGPRDFVVRVADVTRHG
jgi:hypothetical protein